MKKVTKIKKTLVLLLIVVCSTQGTAQLVDEFHYREVDTSNTVSLRLSKTSTMDQYDLKLNGADQTGSINGIAVSLNFKQGTNLQKIEDLYSTNGAIIGARVEVVDLTQISQLVMELNREMCPTPSPCTGFYAGDDDIKLTWSNEATGPTTVAGPSVPQTYWWNTIDKQSLLIALGYPNGKIYKTDYKSSDFASNVTDNEATLEWGTQTIWVGDPIISNKRSPMELNIHPDTEPIVQPRPGVGINTDDPQMSLDVSGLMRSTIRDSNGNVIECNDNTLGAFGFDASSNQFMGCLSNGWVAIMVAIP